MNEMHELSHPKPEKTAINYSFENAEEFYAYVFVNHIKNTTIHWDQGLKYQELYYKGYQLAEDKKYDEAIRVFSDSLRYNPVGINARFELAFCFYFKNNFAKAYEELFISKPYLYSHTLIAKYYRLNGFLLCEKGEYETAYACYRESLELEKNKKAQDELEYIREKAHKSFYSLESSEERKKVLLSNKLYNLHVSNEALIREIQSLRKQSAENQNKPAAQQKAPTPPAQTTLKKPELAKEAKPPLTEKEKFTANPEEYIKILKRNYPEIDGSGYRVQMRNDVSVNKPYYCLRCMQKLNDGYDKKDFYFCYKCDAWVKIHLSDRRGELEERKKEAERKAKKFLRLTIFLSAVLLIILFCIFYNQAGNVFGSYVGSVFLCFIFFCILSQKKFEIRSLEPDIFDNGENNGFYVIKKSGSYTDYIFSNGAYAKVFGLANNARVTKENDYFKKQKVTSPSYIRADSVAGNYTFLIIIIIIIGVGVFLSQPNAVNLPTKAISNSYTPRKTINPADLPTIPYNAKNGEIIINPDYQKLCDFKVETNDSSNYYIILKYIRAPENSYNQRERLSYAKTPYEEDISFYVTGGQTVTIKVPVGVYKLYYATGSTFYGNTKYCFGKDTTATCSDDLFSFYTYIKNNNLYTHGNVVTLYKVDNGNLVTKTIDPEALPI